jgi:hypothetical protein
MRKNLFRIGSPLALTLCVAALNLGRSFGAVVYDESISGDLSNSGLTPTTLTVGAGENVVLATYGIGAAVDRDYFTFTVPSGLSLAAISILADQTSDPGTAFIGVQSGPQVTLPVNPPDATGLLGWLHFTAGSGNIINDLGVPDQGSSGFTPPLASGSYSFWVQELAPGSFTYALDFQLLPATAPDSGPGMFAFAGLFGILACVRKFAPAS